jgi:hypothetical protein
MTMYRLEYKALNALKHLIIVLTILTNFRYLKVFFYEIFEKRVSISWLISFKYDFISRDIFIYRVCLNRFNWFLVNKVYGLYSSHLYNKYF